MKKLKLVLILFGSTSTFLVVLDIINWITSLEDDNKDCNDSYFSGKAKPLNALLWLISRFIAANSANLIVVWLFWKKKNVKDDAKLNSELAMASQKSLDQERMFSLQSSVSDNSSLISDSNKDTDRVSFPIVESFSEYNLAHYSTGQDKMAVQS